MTPAEQKAALEVQRVVTKLNAAIIYMGRTFDEFTGSLKALAAVTDDPELREALPKLIEEVGEAAEGLAEATATLPFGELAGNVPKFVPKSPGRDDSA